MVHSGILYFRVVKLSLLFVTVMLELLLSSLPGYCLGGEALKTVQLLSQQTPSVASSSDAS